MEVLSANRVDVEDNANMVSGGCIDCRPARPPHFPWALHSYYSG